MKLWHSLIRGNDPERPTRFHTHAGTAASPAEALRWPVALAEWTWGKLSQRRPERPWIPPAATRSLALRLAPPARVLEVGGGMSTLWLARRAEEITTFEADEAWFRMLRGILAARGLNHVNLLHRWRAEEMCDYSLVPDRSLDLLIVDGGPRLECLLAAPPMITPGGCIYIDNTDLYPEVKAQLLEFARQPGWRLTFYRGFPPACLYLCEGAILERVDAVPL